MPAKGPWAKERPRFWTRINSLSQSEKELEIASSESPAELEEDCFPAACQACQETPSLGSYGSCSNHRQERPLHFMSRLDGKEHYGQLIRNVGTLARSSQVGDA